MSKNRERSPAPSRGRIVRLAAATALVLGVTLGIGLLVRWGLRRPAMSGQGEGVGGGAALAASFRPCGSGGETGSGVRHGAQAPGIVMLNARPWANVHEGSTSLGDTPVICSTYPGPHTFVFERFGVKQVLHVTVEPGREVFGAVQFGP